MPTITLIYNTVMDIFESIITTTLDSFDFSFCIVVNIATYIIIKILDDINGTKKVSTLTKRITLLFVIIALSSIRYFNGDDIKLILNSSILAPVFWSWIGKPICDKFGIDYKKDNKEI